MNRSERNRLFLGIGLGLTAGFGTGYLVCSKKAEKKRKEEVKKARRKAYLDGVAHGKDPARIREAYSEGYDDGLEKGLDEGKKWIDQHCVIPEEGDTPEDIQKKLAEKQKELTQNEESGVRSEELDHTAAPETTSYSYPDDGSVKTVDAPKNGASVVEVSSPVRMIGQAEYDSANRQVVFIGAGGTRIAYPATLFIGPDGEILDSVDIRNNIRRHEHNTARLNLIWSQMGWGAYIPDLDGPAGTEVSNSLGEAVPKGAEVSEEDINNWDLNIDGDTYSDGDLLMGDEPEEKTREREKYLDEVNRYIANPEEAPRIISRQDFDDECYLDKVYFDYYDIDNKFIENTDVDNEIGPYDYFGVTDGKELFRRKADMVPDPDDDDPDVVHVKNFKMNCVIEVTRYHRSYEAIKDGGAYVQDGSTD